MNKGYWRLFNDWRFITGLVIIFLFLLCGIFAPFLQPNDAFSVDLSNRLLSPDRKYLMGTDAYGRCILSRVLLGTRNTFLLSIFSALITALIGTTLGIISGYYGNLIGKIISTCVNAILSFPPLLLAFGLIPLLKPSLASSIIAVIPILSAYYVRVIQPLTENECKSLYVKYSQIYGGNWLYVFWRHISKAILPHFIVMVTVDAGNFCLIISSLSFLGLGAQPPTPEWGRMVLEGYQYFHIAPHVVIFPGMFIFLAVIGFNLMGESFRDFLDIEKARDDKVLKGDSIHLIEVKREIASESLMPLTGMLDVRDLNVRYRSMPEFPVLFNINFSLQRGKIMVGIGPSGSGKSTLAKALCRLLNKREAIWKGKVLYNGIDLNSLSDEEVMLIRGNKISIVFQNTPSVLNPFLKVRTLFHHIFMRKNQNYLKDERLEEKIFFYLNKVGLSNGSEVINKYPFQLSYGMQKKVALALAISTESDLLIVDEPTAGLDTISKRQVLLTLRQISYESNKSILCFTHDLEFLEKVSDTIFVILSGTIIELAPTEDLITTPIHPFTKELLLAKPKIDRPYLNITLSLYSTYLKWMKGCCYLEICKQRTEKCKNAIPQLEEVKPGHWVACHNPLV